VLLLLFAHDHDVLAHSQRVIRDHHNICNIITILGRAGGQHRDEAGEGGRGGRRTSEGGGGGGRTMTKMTAAAMTMLTNGSWWWREFACAGRTKERKKPGHNGCTATIAACPRFVPWSPDFPPSFIPHAEMIDGGLHCGGREKEVV